jgi:transcriptional regulator with XRE-family HTH domain
MMSEKASHRVDRFIGQRLRQQRETKNITQVDFANALCLPLRTIRRIEAGNESIGALSLYEAAQIAEVPVSFFFEGYKTMEKAE